MYYPKISIVTPSYNQAQYLEHTILSVLDQNYPNLEYIIIDGGSTDGSVEIIQKYAHRLAHWESKKDKGLYYALQKGFEMTTGDIMSWINSDDMMHRNSLFAIAELLQLEGVEWISGQGTLYDDRGRTVSVAPYHRWSKYDYLMGKYQWIQQESTFWKRSLWQRSGGYISTEYKYAGDLELWNRFFKHAKLYTVNCLVGGFRLRTKDQLSLDGGTHYMAEATSILAANYINNEDKEIIERINKIDATLQLLQKTRLLNLFFITNRLKGKRELLLDYPPKILFERQSQQFVFAG